MNNDQILIQLIQQSNIINDGDKNYLLSQLDKLLPIEKLKLQHSLNTGHEPSILTSLRDMRNRFLAEESANNPSQNNAKDPFSKIVNNLFKQPTPKPVSHSFLNQAHLLGSRVPKPIPINQPIVQLIKLSEIQNLNQLKLLSPMHVNFSLNENIDLELKDFFINSTELFEQIDSIDIRRDYILYFFSSALFEAYIDTGLTALRHQELQPASIILNTLYQIDNKYLNNKQFRATVSICNHLRTLCGI
jgi:hypothetical protein